MSLRSVGSTIGLKWIIFISWRYTEEEEEKV